MPSPYAALRTPHSKDGLRWVRFLHKSREINEKMGSFFQKRYIASSSSASDFGPPLPPPAPALVPLCHCEANYTNVEVKLWVIFSLNY